MPPSSILTEEIIIGLLLSDISVRQYIIENTSIIFFASRKHQTLYYNTTQLHQENSTAETINELWKKKTLKNTGGIEYLIVLISKSQTISLHYSDSIHAEYFIKILKQNWTKRLLIQYGYSILQLSHFYRVNIEKIQNKAFRYLEIVFKNKNAKSSTEVQQGISRFLHQINQSSDKNKKILSGFRDLDKITNGFKEGELIIVAGRPSMGKTSFAINIACHNIINLKLPVYIFSLEMSKNEILDKFIALICNMSIQKIQQKTIRMYDWEKVQKACKLLAESCLRINDKESSSIEYIKQQCKSYLNKKKLLLSTTCN